MSKWLRFFWAFGHAWSFARTMGDISRQQRRAYNRQLAEDHLKATIERLATTGVPEAQIIKEQKRTISRLRGALKRIWQGDGRHGYAFASHVAGKALEEGGASGG